MQKLMGITQSVGQHDHSVGVKLRQGSVRLKCLFYYTLRRYSTMHWERAQSQIPFCRIHSFLTTNHSNPDCANPSPKKDQPGRTSQRRPWRNEIPPSNLQHSWYSGTSVPYVLPTGRLSCFPKNRILCHIFLDVFISLYWTKDNLICCNLFLQNVVQNQIRFPVHTLATI